MKLRFNRRSPIGLDIAARSIGAVQLVEVSGGWRIEACAVLARGSRAVKPGAGTKSGGQPSGSVNQDLTSEELQEVIGVLDRQGFVGNRVVVAAPEGAKFSETMELPPRSSGAPIEELAKQELARSAKRDAAAIEVGMWDVPAPARSGSGGGGDGSGGATHLLAVGLAHADADAMIEAIEGAGLVVEALECRCCAMARACAGLTGVGGMGGNGGAAANHVSAILDLSDACASIAVMHSGTVAYDRPVLDTGLSRLREQLQMELRADADAVDYLLDAINRSGGPEGSSTVSAGVGGGAADLPEHSVRTANKLIDEYLAMVVQELRSVMAYAIHRYPGAIGPVLLMGPGASLHGLRDRIRSELDLETRVVSPRDIAACGPELEGIAADASLTAAMGLAMRPARAASRRAA